MISTMENYTQMETEDEKDLHIGYFLRSKRRKLEDNKEDVTFITLPERTRRKKSKILTMPTEVLELIFKLIPFQDLSCNVRLVNRRLRFIAEETLSRSFKMLENRIEALRKSTIEALQTAQEDVEIKCYCRLINMLEIVSFQQNVVISTIWRYALNNKYETYKSCMYGGMLLDAYDNFLKKFTKNPEQLYAPVIGRDYAMPAEVVAIIQMTKTFCLHFEKVNEELINNSLLVSGCKLLDFLDIAFFAQRDVVYEVVEDDGVFKARYNYFINNAWFVALDVNSDKQMSWEQKQRMMHMRIRRIILAHTEMFMQQYQYERELMMRKPNGIVPIIRKPSNNVYTGYGDIQDKFFYYGVMNDGAYIQKFHSEDTMDEEEMNDALEEVPIENEVMLHRSDSEDSDGVQVPHLGIHINVKVKCPLSHAPIKYLNEKCAKDNLSNDEFDFKCDHEKFCLKMEFNCPGAKYPRLPTRYLYKFKHNNNA